jgi:hypothetical protein
MSERLRLGTDATSHCRPVFAVRTEQHVVFLNPRSREAISGMIVVVMISSDERRADADLVVFCFAKPEDADTFCERFSGERSPGDGRWWR